MPVISMEMLLADIFKKWHSCLCEVKPHGLLSLREVTRESVAVPWESFYSGTETFRVEGGAGRLFRACVGAYVGP